MLAIKNFGIMLQFHRLCIFYSIQQVPNVAVLNMYDCMYSNEIENVAKDFLEDLDKLFDPQNLRLDWNLIEL